MRIPKAPALAWQSASLGGDHPQLSCRPTTNSEYGVNDPQADPIEDIVGDYRAFAAQQRDRLTARGIDIAPYALSHLPYRVPEWDQYVHVRSLLERHAMLALVRLRFGIIPLNPSVDDGRHGTALARQV